MHSIIKATIISAILVFTSLQAASAAEGQFYLAPGVQWMDFDEGLDLDDDAGYFFGLGWDITDRMSGEISIFDLDPDNSLGSDTDLDSFSLNLFYDLDRKIGPLETFVVGGMGHTNYSADKRTVWNFGVGIEYKLSDRWTWRTAVRSYHNLSEDFGDNDIGIDSALIFRFRANNSPPASPRPTVSSTTQAPTATPIDTDRDGVPDSRDNCADTPENYAVDSVGCPIAIEEIARVELLLNFDFDRSEVKPEYYAEIEEVAEFMREYPDVMIELEGHTDSRNSDQYNQGLSERRANAVRQVLVERFNIQASRISTLALGESQPVASNETDAGRARNRRVVAVVVKTLQNFQPR